MALKGLGKPDQALKSIDKALNIDQLFAESYYNKGNILLGLNRLDEAVAAFNQSKMKVTTH